MPSLLQADIKEFLDSRGVAWEEVDDLAAVAGDVDVLYQTRIQKERFQVCAREALFPAPTDCCWQHAGVPNPCVCRHLGNRMGYL